MRDSLQCPFCEIADKHHHERIVASNKFAYVIRDGYPITNGHTLVIPRRHVGSFFELDEDEIAALLRLLSNQREELQAHLQVTDYNIGINDGPLAGQTVPHCHIHLIPRNEGDVLDPRGGIRWIIPDKAKYWNEE